MEGQSRATPAGLRHGSDSNGHAVGWPVVYELI